MEALRLELVEELQRPLDAGLPLPEALALAAQDAPSRPVREALGRIASRSHEGGRLSDAVAAERPLADDALVSLVRVGERTGRMSDALDQARRMAAERLAASRRIRDVLLHPLACLAVSAVVLVIVMLVFAPAMLRWSGLGEVSAPRMAMALLAAHPWFIVPLALSIAALATGTLLVTRHPLVATAIARTPHARDVVRHARLSTGSRVLARLLDAQVPAEEAIVLAADAMGDGPERESLSRTGQRIASGGDSQPSGDAGSCVLLELALARRGGPEAAAVQRVAEWHESELDISLQRAEVAANIASLLLAGIGAGSVVVLAWSGYFAAASQSLA